MHDETGLCSNCFAFATCTDETPQLQSKNVSGASLHVHSAQKTSIENTLYVVWCQYETSEQAHLLNTLDHILQHCRPILQHSNEMPQQVFLECHRNAGFPQHLVQARQRTKQWLSQLLQLRQALQAAVVTQEQQEYQKSNPTEHMKLGVEFRYVNLTLGGSYICIFPANKSRHHMHFLNEINRCYEYTEQLEKTRLSQSMYICFVIPMMLCAAAMTWRVMRQLPPIAECGKHLEGVGLAPGHVIEVVLPLPAVDAQIVQPVGLGPAW